MREPLPAGAAVPSAAAIDAACAVLRERLPRTRLVAAEGLSRRLGAPVHLKLESELPTGSFKPRGALYALATRLAERGVREVVASSTGNHGAAVAYAARELGCAATIFLPSAPNLVKRNRIAELGARIVEVGRDIADAAAAARAHAAATDAFYLDDATDAHVPAGAATIGRELLEQAPELDTVIVPMGDTALIRGVAAALKAGRGGVRVIGVQAATAPSYHLSWRAGRPIATATCDTIADGLATRTPHAPNVAAIRALVDDVVLVDDDALLRAVRHLLLDEHVVAEPAGAAATAAALQLGAATGATVVLVSGANLAPAVLRRVAER